jgi:hypothetical protein
MTIKIVDNYGKHLYGNHGKHSEVIHVVLSQGAWLGFARQHVSNDDRKGKERFTSLQATMSRKMKRKVL